MRVCVELSLVATATHFSIAALHALLPVVVCGVAKVPQVVALLVALGTILAPSPSDDKTPTLAVVNATAERRVLAAVGHAHELVQAQRQADVVPRRKLRELAEVHPAVAVVVQRLPEFVVQRPQALAELSDFVPDLGEFVARGLAGARGVAPLEEPADAHKLGLHARLPAGAEVVWVRGVRLFLQVLRVPPVAAGAKLADLARAKVVQR
mmetsp:Transcript_54135/g.154210  ORF Transcript_54135/g.154210 Transcript_54135/m.154210 type:complete len:209 (-) Transcript_54135:39-665(-)